MADEKKTRGMQEVDAVRDPEMIFRIQDRLTKDKGQVYGDIWRVGVNMALRIGDLLALTFEDMKGDVLVVNEQKTGKARSVEIAPQVKEIVKRRRSDHPDHVYLFQSTSNRVKNSPEPKPMNRSGVSRAFKEVGEMASIGVHLGTHSMRKTWGHALYSQGVSIERIASSLNHSTPAVTMRYIGITKQEISNLHIKFAI